MSEHDSSRYQARRPGQLDASFDPDVDLFVYQTLASEYGIYISGSFQNIDGQPRDRLARLKSGGQLDPAFVCQADGIDAIIALSEGPSGTVYANRLSYLPPGAKRPLSGLLRINRDGSVDTGFDPAGRGIYISANCALGLSDGKVLVGGQTLIVRPDGSEYRIRGVARLHRDGSLDATFQAVEAEEPLTLAELPGPRYAIGGNFREVNGQPRKALVVVDSQGAVDPEFASQASLDGPETFVRAILPLEGGSILVAGAFSRANGEERPHLAQFYSNGQLAPGWSVSPQRLSHYAYALLRQPNGKVIVGGEFARVGEAPRDRLARFNLDGSFDPSFNAGPQIGGRVFSLAGQRIGGGHMVIAGGTFSQVNGQPYKYLARFYAGDTVRPDEESGIPESGQELDESPGKLPAGGPRSLSDTSKRSERA